MVKARIPSADLTSLDILFKPENAAKLADCGISILESPADIIPMTLAYLGLDPNTTNPKDFDAVVKAFDPIRQYITRVFDSNNFLNAIPNKELCLITNWAGDYATAAARARDAEIKINLAYQVPETGAPAWFDIGAFWPTPSGWITPTSSSTTCCSPRSSRSARTTPTMPMQISPPPSLLTPPFSLIPQFTPMKE